MNRRSFLTSAAALALSPLFSRVYAGAGRPLKILLRSSWQTVNIGDIAHTPGVLAILERYFPDAEITLWASGEYSEDVHAIESKRFPMLKKVV